MPEPGSTATSDVANPASQAGGTQGEPTPTKTVSQEDFDAYVSKSDKRFANEAKRYKELEARYADVVAEKEALAESGKPDEERAEAIKATARLKRQLDAKEKELNAKEKSLVAKELAKEYGVPESELLDLDSPLEMENYALKASLKKPATKPAPPAGSYDRPTGAGAAPDTKSLEALVGKDQSKMSAKERQEYRDRLMSALGSL